MNTPNTINLGVGLEYTLLCSFFNGSCQILFAVDYSGMADFKFLCCYEENGEYIRPVAGCDYDDVFSVFRERMDIECDLMEQNVRTEDEDE